MASNVFYGSPHQAHLSANETLPAKFDLILNELLLRDRDKDELVCLKLHVGNNIRCSVIHPVFVRKVVQAIKDGGGKPFIVDVDWDVAGRETRRYTRPPGFSGRRIKRHTRMGVYNIKTWKVDGMVQNACL